MNTFYLWRDLSAPAVLALDARSGLCLSIPETTSLLQGIMVLQGECLTVSTLRAQEPRLRLVKG